MRKLSEYLAGVDAVAVAFSGGVDSTFLLQAAKDVLGDGVIALTAVSDFFPGPGSAGRPMPSAGRGESARSSAGGNPEGARRGGKSG